MPWHLIQRNNKFNVTSWNCTSKSKITVTSMDSTERIKIETDIGEVLKFIYDPEIPVNIYDLGLIYDIDIDNEYFVNITMTLTAPNCPMADDLVEEVRQKVSAAEGVNGCRVKLTFNPPWDRSMLSDAAKLELGFL